MLEENLRYGKIFSADDNGFFGTIFLPLKMWSTISIKNVIQLGAVQMHPKITRSDFSLGFEVFSAVVICAMSYGL
jgi:hypothetical protein